MEKLLTPTTFDSQAHSCPSCGSTKRVTESRPPHVALVCADCRKWFRWIRKGAAKRRRHGKLTLPGIHTKPVQYLETAEAVRPDFAQPSPDLEKRVEKLERASGGYDTLLSILVKVILAAGVLQGKGASQ